MMLQRIRWFLLLFGIVVLLVFSLANTEHVPVNMPFVFSAELPLAMLLIVTSAIGFILGSLMTAWMLRRSRKTDKPASESLATQNASETTSDPLPGNEKQPAEPTL